MGIALRQSDPEFGVVDSYYAMAKREPTMRGDLEIKSTSSFTANFRDLVKKLIDKQQSHVVIVTHGYSGGLSMPLTSTTTVSAANATLVDLLALVDGLPIPNDAKLADFASKNSISEADALELAKLCGQVRIHDANCVAVHVRGCNIGVDVANLVTIRKLFRSLVVSAPKCPMLYSPFNPEWHTNPDLDVEAWKKKNKPKTRRREFVDATRSTLVLDLDYAGTKGSVAGAIHKIADLPKWADLIYNNKSHGTSHSMPLAAMWPDTGYFLPHETGYTDQIVASRD
jgi:hypothetical protein